MKRLFIILILFSLCFAITKEVEAWHFTKIDGDEGLAKWTLKQNENLLCWDTSHLDETEKNKLKNLDFGEKDKTKTKKDFDKEGCIKIEKNKKYKIGKNSVEFEFGNITIEVDILYNQKYCFVGSDCIQKYKICSNATITNEVLNAYFLDLLQNKNITTDFELYEMKMQNVSKTGYNTIEYNCTIEEYDNQIGMNITKNSTCYNTTEYTYTTEELVKSSIEPYENCKEIYFNSRFYEAGHYDIIPVIYEIGFFEYDDVYVSYPYLITNSSLFITITNISSPKIFYIYLNHTTTFSNVSALLYSNNISRFFPLLENDKTEYAFGYNLTGTNTKKINSFRQNMTTTYFSGNIADTLYGSDAGIANGTAASTMCAWVYLNRTSLSSVIEGILFYGKQTSGNMRFMGRKDTSPYPFFVSNWGGSVACSSAFKLQEWVFVCAVFNTTHWLLYENGVNCAVGAMTTNTISGNLSVGADYTTQPWLGGIQEVYIYNRALTTSEILDIYNSVNYTINCVKENGIFNVEGKSYSERFNCNVSSSFSSAQVVLPFNYFNETKLYITNNPSSVINAPPEIISISISPTTAYTNDNLNCTIETRDNDTAMINIKFSWYNSSSLFYEYNLTNQNANGTYSSILLSTHTKKHENWTCVANITDGTNSDEKNISKYINNTIYNISDIVLSPDDVRTNSVVMCSAFYYDEDNDNGIGKIKWYINTTNTYNYSINSSSNSSIVSIYPYTFSHGDRITCELIISDGEAMNTTKSNFSYAVLPSCTDYYEDSNLFDKITYGDERYYIPKQTQPSLFPCYNDKIQFIKIHNYQSGNYFESYFISDFNSYGINSGGGTGSGTSITLSYYSPLAFMNNKTFTISLAGNCGGNAKVRITNSTGSYIDITSGSVTFRADNKIVSGTTIGANDNVFNITYFNDLYDGVSSSCSYSICDNSNNAWLCNASFAKRIDKSGIIPYISLQGATTINSNSTKTNIFNQTIYRNISVFAYGRTDNVVLCPSWFCSGVINGKILFMKKENTSGIMLYSNDGIVLPNETKYYVYILQNNEIVRPLLMLYITSNAILDYYPFQYQYSPTTYKIPMTPNVGAIYLDELGLCYFVPPFSPSNLTTVYTLTAYQITCPATLTGTITYPVLPTKKVCKIENGMFVMNITYSDNVIFERWMITNADVVEYATQTSTLYQEAINISQYKTIDLRVNNISRCYYTTNSTLLGLSEFPSFDVNVQRIVITPIILLTTAISSVQPFGFIFVIALNDFFKIFDVIQLATLAAVVSVFAIVSNWHGERNLKTTIILLLITFAYIVSVHSLSEFAPAQISSVQNVVNNVESLFSEINSPADLLSVIAITLPTLFVNLIILLVSLPALLISLLLYSISLLFPALSSALTIFEPALVAGAYAYLILKGYEVGRNMFRPV